MTVRVERSFELPVRPDQVWEFIAAPENRARAISVVERYSVTDSEGRAVTWHVSLPIPLVRRTVKIETEDIVRRPPEYVEFVGRSKVLDVTGEHEVVETETGTRLENRFLVDGHLPGVEKFFKHNLDSELENLRQELERALDVTAGE